MKTKVIISSILIAVIAMAFTAKVTIRIKGSDTILPVSQKVAETYMKTNKDATITVTGGGSGVGLAALLEGTTDIAMASRKMKVEEKQKLINYN